MDDSEDDAMADAMGFSSFGTQSSAKRRKYNPHTDEAFVESSSSQPPRSPVNHGKGANALPLGNRPPPVLLPAVTAAGNKDEISLEDDNDDDPGPQYIDTSRPSAPIEASSASHTDPLVQARLDEIVGSTAPPAQEAPVVGRGGLSSHARPRGRPNDGKPWWDDYYDPATNMNPWEKLEKELGLKPLSNDYLTWEESKASWENVKTETQQKEATST